MRHYDDGLLFGTFIKSLRKKYNLSRAQVAKGLELSSQSSVMNFETGHTSMKLMHIESFCELLPIKISVPVLLSMFEVNTITPPCQCVCHYDLNNSIPDIYNESGGCRLCNHANECSLSNGLWFEDLS